MTQTAAITCLGLWVGPSFLIYCLGGVRYFSSVFLWPVYLFFLLAAALSAFLLEGGIDGLRKFWNYIEGRGFQ